MNLFELARRRERPLERTIFEAPPGVEPVVGRAAGRARRGVRAPAGSRIRISRLAEIAEFSDRIPKDPGWDVVRAPREAKFLRPAPLAVSVSLEIEGTFSPLARIALDARPRWIPLLFETPPPPPAVGSALVLEIEGDDPGDAALIGVCDPAPVRREILPLARGRGVEIGPGANPQIPPAPGVIVEYLEEIPFETWNRRYNGSGKFSVTPETVARWNSYRIGDARSLDSFSPRTLDFIFSSHVFEHFPNPLGVLAAWRERLAPGGVLLGVTPDGRNCFDLLRPPSQMTDWLREEREEIRSLLPSHYEAWCRYTQPGRDPAKVAAAGESIHAHVYTSETFGELLDEAVARLGYAEKRIVSSRNAKDFAWTLRAGG